jgi:nucleotide-binding universal stress UspA family protein
VDTYSFSQSWTAGREAMYELLRKDGQRATSKVKECGEASGVEVREVILEGHPSDEILNFAENNNIDLIVMGTLGKTGLDRFLMGSVAENVVRHAKVPVLVVRGEGQS